MGAGRTIFHPPIESYIKKWEHIAKKIEQAAWPEEVRDVRFRPPTWGLIKPI